MNICGDDRVFLPDLGPCDECAAFQEQLNTLSNTVDGKQDQLTPGEGVTMENNVLSLDIDSIPDMQGATAGNDGKHGLVPKPFMGDHDKVLHGDGTWRKTEGTSFEKVDALPTTGVNNIIYLVPGSSGNGYDMWVWDGTNEEWVSVGSTDIDLSGYYTAVQTDTLLNSKVDKVSGMGLSQNSYTTAEKNKLSALPTATELDTSLNNKQDKLTFDTTPTDGSTNPVTSDGVYDRFFLSDLNLAPIYGTSLTVLIPKGGYLTIDGVLHKATRDLSPGDTPVVGGNVVRSVEFANQAREAVISSSMRCQHVGLSVSQEITLDAAGFARLYELIKQELSARRQGDDTRRIFVHGILINAGAVQVFEALCANDQYARIDIMRYFNSTAADKNDYTGILYGGTWTAYKRSTMVPV